MMRLLKCECGLDIPYNHHYQCYSCNCGKCYNALGSKLAPLEDWKDEYDSEPDDY